MNVFQAPGNRTENFIDTVDAASLPDPSTLNNGDYYIIQAGGTLWGKTWANGDRAISDGTAYSQDADATKQVAEGGTGATTAAGARTNLGVLSLDEIAEISGSRSIAPALYLNGNSANLNIAHDSKWNFCNADGDLPFALGAEVIFHDDGDATIIAKTESTSTREWYFFKSSAEKLVLRLWTDASNYIDITSSVTLTLSQIYRVCVTYNGDESSPTLKLFINGVEDTSASVAETGTYAGMSQLAGAVEVGDSYSSGPSEITLFRVLAANRELTVAEAKAWSKNGILPNSFADEWGGARGGIYISNHSVGTDGWAATRGTVAGNIDSIGGQDDNMRFTLDTSNNTHIAYKVITGAFLGKRVQAIADIFIPSTNTLVDGIQVSWDGAGQKNYSSPPLDSWFRIEVEHLLTLNTNALRFNPLDGGNSIVNDAAGADVFYVRNIQITAIGVLADLGAENFDEATGKLYDKSSNAFVGVGNGVSLVGRAQPVYDKGTFTPGVTFGGANVGMVLSIASGYYTRIGNLCLISMNITFTAKGTSTGQALITGLPFSSAASSAQNGLFNALYAANMAALTSSPELRVGESQTSIILQDWGATGVVVLDESNFTDTTSIRISGIYQIQ